MLSYAHTHKADGWLPRSQANVTCMAFSARSPNDDSKCEFPRTFGDTACLIWFFLPSGTGSYLCTMSAYCMRGRAVITSSSSSSLSSHNIFIGRVSFVTTLIHQSNYYTKLAVDIFFYMARTRGVRRQCERCCQLASICEINNSVAVLLSSANHCRLGSSNFGHSAIFSDY